MKKFIGIGVLCAFLTIPVSNVGAANDDITGHYFESEMRSLIQKGIIGGFGPGEYQPNTKITRAQFASMMVRALNYQGISTVSGTTGKYPFFTDVHVSDWYYYDINAASQAGIINGYIDGSFKPNALISRQEMAVMADRAIRKKGITANAASVRFTDINRINADYLDAVKRLVGLGVMVGKNNAFVPLDHTTRAETSAVINRIINLQGSGNSEGEVPQKPEIPEVPEVPEVPEELPYRVVEFNEDGTTNNIKAYSEFDAARNHLVGNQAIMQGNRVVFIKNGLVTSNRFTEIYDNSNLSGKSRTYVSAGTEFQYLDATEDWVRVSIGYKIGFVKPENVNFIHSSQVKGRSYYENRNGELYHSIYNHINNSKYDLLVGKAHPFMEEGQKYYSQDGVTYYNSAGVKAGVANIYFNTLDLTTPSNYTGEQLDKYLTDQYPETYARLLADYLVKTRDLTREEAREIAKVSPLAGLGAYFKEIEEAYKINALYLMAHAIHESAWGTSSIATDKRNLYGYGAAVDSNPYNGAYAYNSFEESIEFAAQKISTNYLSKRGSYHNGAFLGNKGAGMNVKYASDPYWGEKIAGHMYKADQYLGNLDSK